MQLNAWGVNTGVTKANAPVSTGCQAGTIIYLSGRDQPCPGGYVFSRNTGGAVGVPWKTECTCIGVAPSAPAPAPAPASAPKVSVQTTVSPNIQVSPNISPIFQQQFQPNNSPATAGTSQTLPTSQSSGMPEPTPIQPSTPVYIPPNIPAQTAPLPAPMPVLTSGGGSYVEPAPVTNAAPVEASGALPNWLPYAVGFGAAGILLLMLQRSNRK